MTKTLVIAGHGKKRNGVFDSGATGYIKKGEHRYYKEDFFKAVEKYLPKNHDVILYSTHNVYDYGDIVTLARKYGKDTRVIEMHYDAGVESASGGHVIIHNNYKPDELDLKLRDFIDRNIGVRYNHRGHKGISGRTNLGNCNRARHNRINYRLIELGFGTNKKDSEIMVNNIDKLAKEFVEVITGTKVTSKPKPTPRPIKKSNAVIVDEVIAGKWKTGKERKSLLNKAGYNYTTIQNAVNKKLSGNSKPKLKSTAVIVDEVIKGKWGNNPEREERLRKAGYNPSTIQNAVNKKLR